MSDSSDSDFEDLAAAIKSNESDKEAENSEIDEKVVKSESEDEKPAKKRRKKKKFVDPEEQKELDKFLFGDKEGLLKNLEGNKLFFTDTVGTVEGEDESKKEAVWHDSDDDDFKTNTEYGELRNKRKFERIAGTPSWARLDKKDSKGDSSDDEDITKTVGHLGKKDKSKELDKGELAFKRLAHINRTTLKEGRTTSVEFHPTSTVAIVAGLKGVVSMFAIDGRDNKKVRKIVDTLTFY